MMKTIIIALIICFSVLTLPIAFVIWYSTPTVEQEVGDFSGKNIAATIEQEFADFYGENMLATYVWYKGDIVWSEYDPISNVDSALVVQRWGEANEIVKAINACK